MHIILVSNRMATARSMTLTGSHFAFMAIGLVMLIIVLSSMFSYLTVRYAAEIRMPFLQELLRTISLEESGKSRELLRENLSTMAVRLGQMQGQLMQIDTLGERLANLSGVKIPKSNTELKEFKKLANTGGGGPLVRPDTLTVSEMAHSINTLASQIEIRNQTLSGIETQIFDDRIRKQLLPSASPVDTDARASGFGWRLDPFTGQTAMHEGIDFLAETGTPILAAAAGIVQTSEYHPQYGNMIELSHGNELITRYAHASALFVKPGEFVKRGQRIAAIGSTGRSTGPHLHFEVRIAGVAQNPGRFLDKGIPSLAQNKIVVIR